MDRTTRAFIYASLTYLAVGTVLGLLMTLSPTTFSRWQFSHVHLLLAGFMAMMVFGVAYFILPRFAATALRLPSLVPVHFWLANVSLIAMVIARPMTYEGSPVWAGILHMAVLAQVVSIFLFVINLGWTLLSAEQKRPAEATAATASREGASESSPSLPVIGQRAPAAAALGPDSPVGSWVDRKDGALEILVEAGLRPLQDPQHLAMVRRAGIPLSHACSRHGIPIDDLIGRLQGLPDRGPGNAPSTLTPDDIIGDVVRRHPAARNVLRQRFGEGCFSCPGFETETLTQGALMHGVDVHQLIAELNEAS